MNIVTVSPKYQVVIPKQIRKDLGVKPGAKLYVIEYNNRIEYIPQKPIKEMRGFLKGMNCSIKREKDRL